MALVTDFSMTSRSIRGYSTTLIPEVEVALILNTYPLPYEFSGLMQCDLRSFADPELRRPILAARQMLSHLIHILPSHPLETLAESVAGLARREAESLELEGLQRLEVRMQMDVLVSSVMMDEGEDAAGEELHQILEAEERAMEVEMFDSYDLDIYQEVSQYPFSEEELLPTMIRDSRESWYEYPAEIEDSAPSTRRSTEEHVDGLLVDDPASISGIDNMAYTNYFEEAMRRFLESSEEELLLPTMIHGSREALYEYSMEIEDLASRRRFIEYGDLAVGAYDLVSILGIDMAYQNNVEEATRLAMGSSEEENYGFGFGAVPASESAIESLNKYCVVQEAAGKDECTVCQEGYVVGEIAAWMPCKHHYHLQCIEQWLRLSNMCPLCRAMVE